MEGSESPIRPLFPPPPPPLRRIAEYRADASESAGGSARARLAERRHLICTAGCVGFLLLLLLLLLLLRLLLLLLRLLRLSITVEKSPRQRAHDLSEDHRQTSVQVKNNCHLQNR